jgi:hypothetical protein
MRRKAASVARMPRPRKRPETELSRFLDAALERKGLGHNEFADLIGMHPATLSDLKLRQETPTYDRTTIHRWAVVLDLTGAQEEVLFELVQLAYSTRYVQDLMARLHPLKPVRRVAESPLDYRLPE